jgi:hypothetical protein
MFAGGALATYLVIYWKRQDWHIWMRVTRVMLCAMILFSTLVRTFVYHAGVEPSPSWYAPINDLFFIALSASVILSMGRK